LNELLTAFPFLALLALGPNLLPILLLFLVFHVVDGNQAVNDRRRIGNCFLD